MHGGRAWCRWEGVEDGKEMVVGGKEVERAAVLLSAQPKYPLSWDFEFSLIIRLFRLQQQLFCLTNFFDSRGMRGGRDLIPFYG